jgi:hypothetical protein
MAKTEAPTPRKSRGGSSFIPVAIAVVAVAVFIGWLATARPDPGVAVTEPDAAGAPAGEGGETGGQVTVVEPSQLNGAAARELIGQDVQLTSVPIVANLGPQLFWIELPGGASFLVKLDEGLVSRGTQVTAGRNARIVGRVMDKTEAVLAEWQQAGVLRNESDRLQAEYGTTYIEARQVQPAAN